MQLISPVLRDENTSGGIDGKAFAVAYPSGVAAGGRKCLIRFVSVVTPYAAASLQFSTRVCARYLGLTVFRLAGVGRGTDVDIQRSFRTDDEGMHRMIAAQGQPGDDGFRWVMRNKRTGRQGIAHDFVVELGVNRSLVDADACSTCAPGLNRCTETLNYTRGPPPRFVLQSDQKAPFRQLAGSVVIRCPGVDVYHSARSNHQVPGVTDTVGEYSRAETGWQLQSSFVARTRGALRCLGRIQLVLSPYR